MCNSSFIFTTFFQLATTLSLACPLYKRYGVIYTCSNYIISGSVSLELCSSFQLSLTLLMFTIGVYQYLAFELGCPFFRLGLYVLLYLPYRFAFAPGRLAPLSSPTGLVYLL